MFFRRPQNNNRQSKSNPKDQIPKRLEQTKALLQEKFQDCLDIPIIHKRIQQDKHKLDCLFIYCRGLADTKRIDLEIMPSIHSALEALRPSFTIDEFQHACPFPVIKKIHTLNDAIESIFIGQMVCFIDCYQQAIAFDIIKRPERQPEESNAELSIRGPRDGFVEDIAVNIALIRKRLKTPSLKMRRFIIGERSQTTIYLLYIDDIIDRKIIEDVTKSLNNIKLDVVESGAQLASNLQPRPFTLVPMFDYTGRPDLAVGKLARGRFCLLIDSIPIAMIGPTNLTSLLKSPEDMHFLFLYPSFEYALRLFGLVVALFLPGIWIALKSYHPDQIPFSLLSTLVLSHRGVPLSPPLEALIMLILFELFREAGFRLPSRVGQTLSVVGGLIVGDAAIRGGLTSPTMVVVIAIAFVASSTLVNQALVGMVGIARLAIAIIASLFGIFGIIISFFAIISFLAQLRSFGIPYLSPLSPFNWRDTSKTVFRSPFKQMTKRPEMLLTQDDTRQQSSSQKGYKR